MHQQERASKHPADDAGISRPWYREKWVWLLIAIPASSVIFGIIMLTLAIRSDTALVSDDYYKEGLAINQTMARERVAETLGLQGSMTLDDSTGQLSIVLDSTISSSAEGQRLGHIPTPPALVLEVAHPTKADQDAFIQLYPSQRGSGSYGSYESFVSAEVLRKLSGRRYFSLTDSANTWRIRAEGNLAQEDTVAIGQASE
ncbi:FixH family protein [Allohahella sp. A8]|uniref:FixH family protein n=1 Tax=Allohahella sp. A8 TaxID=3141461 RepID=UPI003A806787